MNTAKSSKHSGMIKRDLPNLIVGLGKTGLSCARFFARQGLVFAAIDSRDNPPELAAFRREFPEAQVYLGGFDPMVIFRAQRLIVSPGVALSEAPITAAVNRGAEAVGDIELFARTARAPVIAITGANGKSTVTTLVGEMVSDAGYKARVGGNLGTPALDLLKEEEPDFYVLELSSFQLESTSSLDCAAAAVLNITPDHMDRYRDIKEYAGAKARIYHGTGVAVINADDPLVSAMAPRGRRISRFGLSAPVSEQDFGVVERAGQPWLACGSKVLMSAAELRIKGMHNIANALAALALGSAVGLPMDTMLSTLRRFAGLPHRTQWVATRGGVSWYNDSKGTNVGATLAALQGMPGRVVLIAGGLGKGQDFSPLKEAAVAKARAVVLMGRDAPLIERALQGAVPVVRVAGMDEAVQHAAELAQSGDTVLLSPACASFDMFKGYDHRGDAFAEAVRSLPA